MANEPDAADEYILRCGWGMIGNDPDTLNSLRAAIRDTGPWTAEEADSVMTEHDTKVWHKEVHGWRLVLADFVTEHPSLPPGTRIQNVSLSYLNPEGSPLCLMSDGEPFRKLAAYLYERGWEGMVRQIDKGRK